MKPNGLRGKLPDQTGVASRLNQRRDDSTYVLRSKSTRSYAVATFVTAVRCRCAVQHKIGFIGMKDFGCEFLRIFRRSFMNKQIAQFYVSVTHIGAKDVLTKEIVKNGIRQDAFKTPC